MAYIVSGVCAVPPARPAFTTHVDVGGAKPQSSTVSGPGGGQEGDGGGIVRRARDTCISSALPVNFITRGGRRSDRHRRR